MDSRAKVAPLFTKLQVAILFLGLALFVWAILYTTGNETAHRWAFLGPVGSFSLAGLGGTDMVLRWRRRKSAAR